MIDLWEPRSDQAVLHEWYQNTVPRLAGYNFKCIINACYGSAIDYLHDDPNAGIVQDRSHYNTMRVYNGLVDHQPQHKRYQQNDQLLLNNLHNCRGANTTSIVVKQQLLNNDRSFFLTEVSDFLHHWQHYLEQSVKHWLVIGQAWNLCVHNRSIGLKNLWMLTDQYSLKFYGKIWGFLDSNLNTIQPRHFKRDQLPWNRVSFDTYELGAYK